MRNETMMATAYRSIPAACTNNMCSYEGEIRFPDKMPSDNSVCPECGFKTLSPYHFSDRVLDLIKNAVDAARIKL